jgi:hypothetical protein
MLNLYNIQNFEIVNSKEEYLEYRGNNSHFTDAVDRFGELDLKVTGGMVEFPFCVGLVEDEEDPNKEQYSKVEVAELTAVLRDEVEDIDNTLRYLIRSLGGAL